MYEDLDKKSVIDYLKTHTAIFDPEAGLSVYEIGDGADDGDGFINFLYRVWDDDDRTRKSVIVKQAKKYYKAFGEGEGPFVLERNRDEASLLKLKGAITPEYYPKVYHVDPANHLYVCEDCGDLKILRFELMRGRLFPRFPEMIGEFVAKNNFYTSELYLEPEVHQQLEARYINTAMRKIFQTQLFLKDESEFEGRNPHDNPNVDQVRLAMGDLPWKSKAFRTEMLKLRHIHMAKPECLVHGDLHTSNIMIGPDAMKVIDMEYSIMGAMSSDSGYLMGSLLYEYLRWFYLPDWDTVYCQEMREAVLGYMKDFVAHYRAVFRACWEKDARVTYQGFEDYCDYMLDTWFHEMVGFTGCQIISRVGNLVPLPDFDTIPDAQDRYEACRISLIVAEHLIMHRDEIADGDALIGTIVKITESSRRMFQAARRV